MIGFATQNHRPDVALAKWHPACFSSEEINPHPNSSGAYFKKVHFSGTGPEFAEWPLATEPLRAASARYRIRITIVTPGAVRVELHGISEKDVQQSNNEFAALTVACAGGARSLRRTRPRGRSFPAGLGFSSNPTMIDRLPCNNGMRHPVGFVMTSTPDCVI
ncbi:hypothetical protein [Mesorhizobium sp. SP-1A]|uniref:hypothetical protein n=1 Tax=Mesorhizobium sp. SP-1A TaxID=3077840 RepID=UPI0028F6D20D|nr:hypothetical protein [Mesorhizobium sp. SP-1A]